MGSVQCIKRVRTEAPCLDSSTSLHGGSDRDGRAGNPRMGLLQFQLPGNLSADSTAELQRAFLAGGYDHAAVPARLEIDSDLLTFRRETEESGYLNVPWDIPGAGRLMGVTTTLMERPDPYRLLIELARGKVNQVRSQAAEWKHHGAEIRPEIDEHIRAAVRSFGLAAMDPDSADAEAHARDALSLAYEAAEALVSMNVEREFARRRANRERSNSLLACRIDEVPSLLHASLIRQALNAVCLPLNWRATEPTEANYQWSTADAIVDWAVENQLALTAGPLIDFSNDAAPDWLRTWHGDLPALASFMCDYIETAIARYRNRIRRWVICTGSNCSSALGLSEDDLIRLTARLAEAAWGIDPGLEVVIGMSQPWGEYLASGYFNYSPFVFADTLLRAGLPLAGFELEWHMGFSPPGSFCRDPLDAARLLDLFGMLGCPVQISMNYPSSAEDDPQADPSIHVGSAGWWHGLTPVAQAEWVEAFATLALARTNVIGVCWNHLRDGLPHRNPNGGLIDNLGRPKLALDRFRFIRDTHLRSPGDTMIM